MTEQLMVEIEGRKIPIDAALAATDDLLRRAFSSIFAWAIDARVDRTKESEGVLKLVKAAGTKGNGKKKPLPYPLRRLLRCKGGKNPVIELYDHLAGQQLGHLEADEQLVLEKKVRATLELGQEHISMMKQALDRLTASLSRPSSTLPFGF